MDWTEAACRDEQVNPDWFFADEKDEETTLRAQLICAGCPLQLSCLREANLANERYGVWGGLTASQRRYTGRLRPVRIGNMRQVNRNPARRLDRAVRLFREGATAEWAGEAYGVGRLEVLRAARGAVG